MRVGVVCDGSAEVEVLKVLLKKIVINETELLGAAYADMQPAAPVSQIVNAARSRLDIWRARSADKIIIAIDREQSPVCPGERGLSLRDAFWASGYGEVEVVVKDRKLENWLIADAAGLSSLKGFSVPAALVRRIESAGADSLQDAQRDIERSSAKGYSKRRDAIQIAQVADVRRIERNSRSFRRFLRHAGHPAYSDQSRRFVG